MKRRTFVTACGVTALAGCFGTDGDEPGNESQSPADGPSANNESTGGNASNESAGDASSEDQGRLGATDPDPIEYSGSGNARTDPFEAREGLTVLRVEPVANMAVAVVDSQGDVWRRLEWDLRNYQGLVPVDIPAGQYTLAVRTDRDWTIQVIQPEVGDGDLVTPEATLSGTEPKYLGPVDFSEVGSVAVNHAGVGEFSLKLYDLSGEYLRELYNQQGIFEADVTVDYGGQGWLLIAASSEWEITAQTDGGDTQPTGSLEPDDGGNSSGGNTTSGGTNTTSGGNTTSGNTNTTSGGVNTTSGSTSTSGGTNTTSGGTNTTTR